MKCKVNGTEYELEFGMKFINQLDKRYSVNYQGFQFGMGVNLAFMYLNQYNPPVILNIVSSALSHLKTPPTDKDIEEAIVQYAIDNEGLDGLFEGFLDELGNSPLLKSTIKKFKQTAAVEVPDPEATEE